jgi:voltage-gated potassium channel Kch
MHSLIIGGGKIGYYLTKVLIEKGYDVSVVEKEKEACQKFANDLNITVIKGDGTSVSVLEQAGVADADSVIAVAFAFSAPLRSSPAALFISLTIFSKSRITRIFPLTFAIPVAMPVVESPET